MTAPVLVGCLLLVVAGVLKFRRPDYTVGALRSVGLPASTTGARVLGAAELGLGLAAGLAGHPLLLGLVSLAYAAFAGFVARALAVGGAVASCGCVGRPDTPPTAAHLAVTGGLSVAAAVAAVQAAISSDPWVTSGPVTGRTLALLALTGLATWLTWLALAVLPQTQVREIRRRET